VHTDQFITERTYLKGVSPATLQWHRSSFKAFNGAMGSKQEIIGRIAELRNRAILGNLASVKTDGALSCLLPKKCTTLLREQRKPDGREAPTVSFLSADQIKGFHAEIGGTYCRRKVRSSV